MFAMFCGTISWRLRMDTFSMSAKRARCCRPTVANAQAVFDSSWGLKLQIAESVTAASPRAWNSSAFAQRLLANAHSALEISCGFISCACATSSIARLLNTTRMRRFIVAKDHAIVDKHWTLNSPSCRRSRRVVTFLKRSQEQALKDSLAKAQRRLDSSYGLNSQSRGDEISAMAAHRALCRSCSVAQDQLTMLMHCTGISQFASACSAAASRRLWLVMCWTMAWNRSWKVGCCRVVSR
mmetsp:Transcript_94919/g.245091  ORF Transcript_94919/g.245091 Transcript_94919/m.245091 type:complete len:239 (+) Transcript_94919:761-1477(+)